MQHKVKVTVIDKKLYPDLQEQYCANPLSGMCTCYNVGDEFIFERYDNQDNFWQMGLNTLTQTTSLPEKVAGGTRFPHCSEAWDAISRYIYTGLQGGTIMRGWMKEERVMITCCNDGTRPVIFKIERLDYKAIYLNKVASEEVVSSLKALDDVNDVIIKEKFIEVFLEHNIRNEILKVTIENHHNYLVKDIQ